MAIYHAVSIEKRFTEETGHFNAYSILVTRSNKKSIQKWIETNSTWECEIMTQKQYENALDSENI